MCENPRQPPQPQPQPPPLLPSSPELEIAMSTAATVASAEALTVNEPPPPVAGWSVVESEEYPGHFYYINNATGEAQWEKPDSETERETNL